MRIALRPPGVRVGHLLRSDTTKLQRQRIQGTDERDSGGRRAGFDMGGAGFNRVAFRAATAGAAHRSGRGWETGSLCTPRRAAIPRCAATPIR